MAEGGSAPIALIVEDDKASRNAMRLLVESEGFEVATAGTVAEARECFRDKAPDLLLADLGLPDGSGLDLVDSMTKSSSNLSALVITGETDVAVAVEAMRSGASDYLVKPIDPKRLRAKLRDFCRVRAYASSCDSGEAGAASARIVGASSEIRKVIGLLERVGPTDAPVLIVGESGTGKELVARATHEKSARADKEFIAVNCGAIPQQLTESQLFGHKKGSFTGAVADHVGFFEKADGGSLFLDEITEMPIDTQVKLLRTLETGKVIPVGEAEERAVDVRIIAATNREPEVAIADQRLREDLFYRLNVFPVSLPPLRVRGDDVTLIAETILKALNAGDPARPKRLSAAARDRLLAYQWPGNVRELRNVVTRAFILADDEIQPDHLTGLQTAAAAPVRHGERAIEVPIGTTIADAERALILATLESVDGARKEAAEILGVSVKTLYNRLSAYEKDGGEN